MSADEVSPGAQAPGQALAGLASLQQESVSKDWSAMAGVTVVGDPPSVGEVHATELSQAVAFPAVAAKVVCEGELKGEFLVILKIDDALALCGASTGKPAGNAPQGKMDGAASAAVGKLFEAFGRSTQKAFRKGLEKKPTVHVSAAKEIPDIGVLASEGIPFEGWLVRMALTPGKMAPVTVFELIPHDLGEALAGACRALAAPSSSSKGTVLVVEDSYLIRSLVRRHLTAEGYEVTEAVNGVEALQKIRREKVVAVLLDVMMPEMDGLDVCRKLRSMPEGKNLPVVMCTAKGQREDVLAALQAGATDYVVKPFMRHVLVKKLTLAIERAASGGAASAPE
ncbi:MAG: response regulator [Planctomycetes bacterium]|nr:response regulator [Planctomycetota bacterium]